MNRSRNILLIFLLFPINLSAQVIYDTIPKMEEELNGVPEEFVIFKDFTTQALAYFDKIYFEDINCYGKKVFVSTIFGEDGKIKNTSIIKSVNPICDSIAFYFVDGLKDWLPGLQRGKFVDIPFTFSITFDREIIMKRNYEIFFYVTEEEYEKRKEYFDFFYSTQYEQKIINDFDFFKKYLAGIFRDSRYVYILSNYRLKKKESVELYFNPPIDKLAYLLVRDGEKDWLLYEYSLKKNKVRIPKNKNLFLIIFKEGTVPLLQTEIIHADNDTIIDLKLDNYSKGRLLDDIKSYTKNRIYETSYHSKIFFRRIRKTRRPVI